MSARQSRLPAVERRSASQAGNETAHPGPLSTENIGQQQRIIPAPGTSPAATDCCDWHDQDGNEPVTLGALRFDAPACVAGGIAAPATEPTRWPTPEDWWPPVGEDVAGDTIVGGLAHEATTRVRISSIS